MALKMHHMGERRTRAQAFTSHAYAGDRIAADRGIDAEPVQRFGAPMHKCEVHTVDQALCQLLLQQHKAGTAFGDDQQTGGITIEAMHYSSARQLCKPGAGMQQSVH